MKTEKQCVICSNLFTPKRHDMICCSKKCGCKRNTKIRYGIYKCPTCGIERFTQKNRKYNCAKCNNLKKSQIRKGVALKSPKTRAFSMDHCLAVEGLLRDPNCIVRYFRNLRKFVNDNPELFNPDDIVIKKHGHSRASCGLAAVYNGKRGSWKGWTLVSDVEISEGQWDLLRRRYNENPTILNS